MRRFVFCFVSLLGAVAVAGVSTSSLHMDRPYTLRNSSPFLLEREMHRQITAGTKLRATFPALCSIEMRQAGLCEKDMHFVYEDSSSGEVLGVSPLLGFEHRDFGAGTDAVDLGLFVTGRKGIASFDLDARMFTEKKDDLLEPSYDREFVEVQKEGKISNVDYASYARYRSSFTLDLSFAALSFRRDTPHWGPGLYHNLVFNQGAVPFNFLTLSTDLGPISVTSLYGRLAIDGEGAFRKSTETRSVYAHRYEWRISKNLLLGISEQLILYEVEEPFAFVPLVPLFMEKGQSTESSNNGNIAGDISWKWPGVGRIYSEFLIDDLQEPTSLFNDFWGNKWAWMTGLQLVREYGKQSLGFVTEFSRVEPWVYTHYVENTAQAANRGVALGNQSGPNSMDLTLRTYLRSANGWYLALQNDLHWKGTDQGSFMADYLADNKVTRKIFLDEVGSPVMTWSPYAAYRWKFLFFESWSRFNADEYSWFSRIQLEY